MIDRKVAFDWLRKAEVPKPWEPIDTITAFRWRRVDAQVAISLIEREGGSSLEEAIVVLENIARWARYFASHSPSSRGKFSRGQWARMAEDFEKALRTRGRRALRLKRCSRAMAVGPERASKTRFGPVRER